VCRGCACVCALTIPDSGVIELKVHEYARVQTRTYMHLYALVTGSTGTHTADVLWYYGGRTDEYCSCKGFRTRKNCSHLRWVKGLPGKNLLGDILPIDDFIEREVKLYKSSLNALNELFDGAPYSNDAITVFYGKPKVGKSLLVLQEAAYLESEGYRVLIIDTEGSLRESARYWLPILRNRFNSKNKGIYVVKKLTLQVLGDFMGKKVTVVTKGNERKGGKTEFYVIGDTVDLLGEAIKKYKIDVVIVDSITAPIRTAITATQQNLPAKSDAEAFLMGRLLRYIDVYGVAVIVTAHASFNPANPYETMASIRGGVSILHFAKNVVYIDRREKKEIRDIRRFWLVRHGSNAEEFSKVSVARITDIGYVDVEGDPTDYLTDAEIKRLGK